MHTAAERSATRGILVVVGGPQYRVGSHRQFVLLGRAMARANYPVLRFDYRGMGDSEGEPRTFEFIDEDIRSAIDAFFVACRDLRDVVIFGLCDAASAALLYAHTDPRVSGLVIVNPWVRSAQSEARTYLRHYYLSRVLSRGFWDKVREGGMEWRASLRSLLKFSRNAYGGTDQAKARGRGSLEARMAEGLERFSGRVLLVLSGADLTAAEFRDTAAASAQWSRLLSETRVSICEFPEADHTLSTSGASDQLFARIRSWLEERGA